MKKFAPVLSGLTIFLVSGPLFAASDYSGGIDSSPVNVRGTAATQELLNNGVQAITPLHKALVEQNRIRADLINALTSGNPERVAKAISEDRPAMEKSQRDWFTEVHQPINRFRLEIANKKSELRGLLAAGGIVSQLEEERQADLHAQADELLDARSRLKVAQASGDPDEIADARFELVLAAQSHAQQEKLPPIQVNEDTKRRLAEQIAQLNDLDGRFKTMARDSKTAYAMLRARLRDVKLIERVDLPIERNSLDVAAIRSVALPDVQPDGNMVDAELSEARRRFRQHTPDGPILGGCDRDPAPSAPESDAPPPAETTHTGPPGPAREVAAPATNPALRDPAQPDSPDARNSARNLKELLAQVDREFSAMELERPPLEHPATQPARGTGKSAGNFR